MLDVQTKVESISKTYISYGY